MRRPHVLLCSLGLMALLIQSATPVSAQSLPSWRDGESKKAIVDFVERVSRRNSPEYVEPQKRIAVFDNDGTLWPEQPSNFQLMFAVDSVKALAPQHPQWHNTQPFKSVLAGDLTGLESAGDAALLDLLAVSHAGMTTDEYAGAARSWMNTARHPRFNQKYSTLVYQPMIELLEYLRGNGFRTFIVSGGGAEFMRVFAEQAYGIPPERVIGSTGMTSYSVAANGQPVLIKQAKVEHLNDGPGKPTSIHRSIGRRPIFAFGNSDGDLEMLQWTAGGEGARFLGLVHHTDEKREYAYDRKSKLGRLDKALDEARRRDWTVVDMKRDWREVFPPTASSGQ